MSAAARVLSPGLARGGVLVPDDTEHLAPFLTDQFVERDARFVVVRGLYGSAGCLLICIGHRMVDMDRPRNPLVGVG